MNINAEKCLTTGGNIALGFIVDENRRFQVDEETAPIVQQIFEMYAKGEDMATTTRFLNNLHVKTSRGNENNKNSLRRILTNKDILVFILPFTATYQTVFHASYLTNSSIR